MSTQLQRAGWDLTQLVTDARAGQDSAWEALIEEFSPSLRAVARRYRLGSPDIEEVVQQTWLKCLENLDQLRNPEALPGWLMTTCRRECLTIARRTAQHLPHDPELVARLAPAAAVQSESRYGDPAAAAETAETVRAVRLAVSRLPESQRGLVRGLLDADGSRGAYRELAGRLSMPIGSVGPSRIRAFRVLRRQLQPQLQ